MVPAVEVFPTEGIRHRLMDGRGGASSARGFGNRDDLAGSVNLEMRGCGKQVDRSNKRIVKIFRRQALRELKKIKMAWPELNYRTAKGVLIILPSATPTAPSDQGQLTS